MTAESIIKELQSVANKDYAKHYQKFFKTGIGQYGEGDLFLGIRNPTIRDIAKKNKKASLDEIQLMLKNAFHEVRLCALIIMTIQYNKASEKEQKEIVDLYLQHTHFINNWDLVDITAPHIIGAWFFDKDRDPIYKLADSGFLWEERIAIISTMTFIKHNDFADTLSFAKKFINHPHDLIHKAIGWTLREIGKRDLSLLNSFLETYANQLPRTALRYAIEKHPEEERLYFLKKK